MPHPPFLRQHLLVAAVVLGFGPVLSGCVPTDVPAGGSATGLQMTVPAARSYYGGHTFLSYDPGHGAQIEYLDPNGASFLWYPGNRSVLVGAWKLDGFYGGRPGICFRYGANTYNPVTQARGGDWDCVVGSFHTLFVEERLVGDPFNLASGKLPYVLGKNDHPAAVAARKAGLPAGAIQSVPK